VKFSSSPCIPAVIVISKARCFGEQPQRNRDKFARRHDIGFGSQPSKRHDGRLQDSTSPPRISQTTILWSDGRNSVWRHFHPISLSSLRRGIWITQLAVWDARCIYLDFHGQTSYGERLPPDGVAFWSRCWISYHLHHNTANVSVDAPIRQRSEFATICSWWDSSCSWVTPSFSIPRAFGGLLRWWYMRHHNDETTVIVIASGLILGEGVLSVLNLGLVSMNVPHL